MIDFEYHSPNSLQEVFGLLDQYGDDARVMAGGTALVMQMKTRLSQPGHVISLRNVPGLTSIASENQGPAGQVRIGAMCTHRQVEIDPIIASNQPLLAETMPQVSTPRIRSMATLGGGLVNGDPNQDPPQALIALGASAVLESRQGQRVVSLEDLFIDYYETDVRPGEVLTSIVVPAPPVGAGYIYMKFLPRTADDYATISVATVLTPGEGNTCQDVRIVLGSAGVTPIRAIQAEDLLRGQELTEETIRSSAAAVRDAVDPLDDFRGSGEYKRDMAEVFTRRAIQHSAASSIRA